MIQQIIISNNNKRTCSVLRTQSVEERERKNHQIIKTITIEVEEP